MDARGWLRRVASCGGALASAGGERKTMAGADRHEVASLTVSSRADGGVPSPS